MSLYVKELEKQLEEQNEKVAKLETIYQNKIESLSEELAMLKHYEEKYKALDLEHSSYRANAIIKYANARMQIEKILSTIEKELA